MVCDTPKGIKNNMLTHIAHDCQTNELIPLFTDDSKKELVEKFASLSCHPMYVNSKLGDETFLIGWIVGGRWLEVYSVTAMRELQ